MNDRSAIRPPLQARSRETLGRLLAAAREMLEATDWGELAVTDLCRRASSSVGSFYARFPGKDALLDSLSDEARRELDELLDWCEQDARRRGLPAASRLRQLVAALARFTERQRGVLRALVLSGRALPWSAAGPQGKLLAILDGNRSHREAALAVLLAACLAIALGSAAESHGPGPPDPEALAEMLSGYLATR